MQIFKSEKGLTRAELSAAVQAFLREHGRPKKMLILPPDFTRLYSGAGMITAEFIRALPDTVIDVMPALGTHEPMTKEQCDAFFEGTVAYEQPIRHDWRHDVVTLGTVPGDFVASVSEGLVTSPIDVEVNKRLLDPSYDLILSVGQVVPHEVVGMANYSKNIFVGCGGSSMINSSHMLGAFYGLERTMGRDHAPVREVFDYAQTHFLSSLPLTYALTVATNSSDVTNIHELIFTREREGFEQALKSSQEKNLVHMDRPFQKAVVYLDPREFKTTWLGNKAIYRTRMAMKTGGELLILAPGVRKFGEDAENDRLIRKYGDIGRENILKLVKEHDDLKANMSVAAHLIHGSSDGRFHIAYAVKEISEEEVRSVGFASASFDEMAARYAPEKLKDGWNILPDGEEIYYISNPALGLWMAEER
ncbi:MAG: lactate racemase domain-containing protein [Clostridia bacterium]|nr:lactate racemase domain-containing protein [Clostridia bacterium]